MLKATETFWSGLPWASVTWKTTGCGNAAEVKPVCPLPLTSLREEMTTLLVRLNTTEPTSGTDSRICTGPGTCPSTTEVLKRPALSDVLEAFLSVAEPDTTVQVPFAASTGPPQASVTIA